jgi:hypothetical protein
MVPLHETHLVLSEYSIPMLVICMIPTVMLWIDHRCVTNQKITTETRPLCRSFE